MASKTTPPTVEDLIASLQIVSQSAHLGTLALRARLQEVADEFMASIKPRRLLHLPYELRKLILEHVVMLDKPLLPSVCRHNDRDSAAQPAITKVCKQLRNEALPMFYARNTFDYHLHGCDFGHFFAFMDAIGEENRSHIKTVGFTLMNRLTCGSGVLDFVRWYACCAGVGGMRLYVNLKNPLDEDSTDSSVTAPAPASSIEDMSTTINILDGAVSLAKKLKEKGKPGERRLRKVFEAWLYGDMIECCCDEHFRHVLDGPFKDVCSDRARSMSELDAFITGCEATNCTRELGGRD